MNESVLERFAIKQHAKSVLFRAFPYCIAATFIARILNLLGNLAASFLQPSYQEIMGLTAPVDFLRSCAEYYGVIIVLAILISPLTLGLYYWLSELSMERRKPLREIFHWVSSMKFLLRAYGAMLYFVAIAVRWFLTLLAIPVGLFVWLMMLDPNGEDRRVTVMLVLVTLLVLVGVVLVLARVLSYFPALFVAAGHPNMPVRQAFVECRSFMRGRTGEFLKLYLSFLLWFLMEQFSYGIFSLYVRPYYYLSVISYTQYVRSRWMNENGMSSQGDAWHFGEMPEGKSDGSDYV